MLKHNHLHDVCFSVLSQQVGYARVLPFMEVAFVDRRQAVRAVLFTQNAPADADVNVVEGYFISATCSS